MNLYTGAAQQYPTATPVVDARFERTSDEKLQAFLEYIAAASKATSKKRAMTLINP